MGFPTCHIGQKKFYWASVLSTILLNEPFGNRVKRLRRYWYQTYGPKVSFNWLGLFVCPGGRFAVRLC